MIDRTDLQLMLCEQIMEMGNDEMIELANQLIGHDLEAYDEASEVIVGSLETIDIEDPHMLKKWLGFLLYALGERVDMTADS